MNYKITLYNNKFYKEIKLDEKVSKGLFIGTGKECQVRFFREQFFTDFIIRLEPETDGWIMTCGDSVYLKKDNAFKTYIQHLAPQDVITVCYDVSDTELFRIEFSIDFNSNSSDYSRQISIEGQTAFTIGGASQSTIRLEDAMLGNDYISISRSHEGMTVNQQNMHYNIMINGFQIRQQSIKLSNQDFFALNGYSFYLKDDTLYTSKDYRLSTQLPETIIKQEKNHLSYPCFIRSARQQFEIPEEKIQILPPKNKPEESKKNLVMTMVPILMSMGMMVLLRMSMGGNKRYAIMCIGMAAVSLSMSVFAYRNESVLHRKKLVKRENDYNKYIAEQEVKIQHLREKEKDIFNQMNPSLIEHLKFVDDFDSRLFEKLKKHDDYLTIRIGEGAVESKNQIEFKPPEYREVDDPFMDYPEKIHDKYRYISNMPILLDLKEISAIGIIGGRNKLYQFAKNMILILATEHYYQDVQIFLVMDDTDVKYFSWARWLKNMYQKNSIRNFVYDENSSKIVMEYIYSELCRREELKKEEIAGLPQVFVLVYRSEEFAEHPISKYVEKGAELGFVFVFFEECTEFLNEHCQKRIFLHEDKFCGYIQDIRNGEQVQAFEYPHVKMESAAKAALKLACVYVHEANLEASLTKNITLYQLLNIINAYDLDIETRWKSSKVYESMAAPLGVKRGDEIVSLDLHEKYHGPHGLVAGTTGSGKSEILQSYILSMAIKFHPYDVGFIIIDFKGGGMVNQFKDLPHLNGAITNIDDGEIDRSLSSIKAELEKRQRLFAEHEVNHIDNYIKLFKDGKAKEPLPHLILIVDEFAELKSEQPDFMKELISTARIGRSLGVHLILATQKPAGVVNNQIWSNSRFKLCLKVQDKGDSNEVIKSPLAAEIKEPGRAYLQVGNNEIFDLFQSAYSGAGIPNNTMGNRKKFRVCSVNMYGARKILYEQKPEADAENITQLEAIVEYIKEYCDNKEIKRLPSVCLPALEENIPYGLAPYTHAETDITVPIGIYDDPSKQYQGVTDVDFTQGHIMIVGSAQYGKTNLLQVMIRGIAEHYTSNEVNLYILDFASMILKSFESLKHVGDVILSSDDEKVKNFLKRMSEELEKRRSILSELGLSSYSAYLEAGKREMPQIIVMIDNLVAFRSMYEQYDPLLLELAKDGNAVGICLVATAQQTMGIGNKFVSNFPRKIALYCNQNLEYSVLFEKCKIKLKETAGRGIVSIDKKCFEAQMYLAFPAEKEIERVNEIKAFIQDINNRDKGDGALKTKVIPDIVTPQIISDNMTEEYQPYMVPLGYNFANMEIDTINMGEFALLGISGSSGMGRTNFVKYMVNVLSAHKEQYPVNITVIDSGKKRLETISGKVETYTFHARDTRTILKQIMDTLSKRQERRQNDDAYELSNEPLEFLVINARDAYSVIEEDAELLETVEKIIKQFSRYKCSIILSDVPNVSLTSNATPLIKMLNAYNNILIFRQLQEQQFFDVGFNLKKQYGKPLSVGEAYLKIAGYIGKYKTPLCD